MYALFSWYVAESAVRSGACSTERTNHWPPTPTSITTHGILTTVRPHWCLTHIAHAFIGYMHHWCRNSLDHLTPDFNVSMTSLPPVSGHLRFRRGNKCIILVFIQIWLFHVLRWIKCIFITKMKVTVLHFNWGYYKKHEATFFFKIGFWRQYFNFKMETIMKGFFKCVNSW